MSLTLGWMDAPAVVQVPSLLGAHFSVRDLPEQADNFAPNRLYNII
jgi:hypothetical protein